jgi:hypothetical protein
VYEALLLSCLLPFRCYALIDMLVDGKFNIAMSHRTKVIYIVWSTCSVSFSVDESYILISTST